MIVKDASSSFDFDNFRATSSTCTASVVGIDSDSCSLSMRCSTKLDGTDDIAIDGTDDIAIDGTTTGGGGTADNGGVTTGNTSTGHGVDFFVFLVVSGSTSVCDNSSTCH